MKKTTKVRQLRRLELLQVTKGPAPLQRTPMNRQQRRAAARQVARNSRRGPV
jgi:hypothetical protein